MTVTDAIADAERLLPGVAADEGIDPRWQAIIAVGEFIEDHPDEVWRFVAKWGCTDDADLRAALATCLVEHLLERHFDRLFPRVEALATNDRRFARVFFSCWDFGQARQPENLEKVSRLRRRCERVAQV